jgi:class 3 adenylate cyclase/tetratricopeptide (TPR) repeat protein
MPVCSACAGENPEGSRFCNLCGESLVAPSPVHEIRKTVSVLFCDVVGSTALGEATDPESLRITLAAYFGRMRGIVEKHGGTLEKFIGDAVMAVFGVPMLHEDDALRACRAAIEMQEAAPGLGMQLRIGVNTGEVVAGTSERLVTGDAVNLAARLEQAAGPGEILIGDQTFGLVRAFVQIEPAGELRVKGKAAPVVAYRLLGKAAEPERSFSTPMVGRDRELRALRESLSRAVHDRSCQLFTVLGAAGVGKSRLAAELLVGAGARVVRGRCLPYGEDITYWPVVEIVQQLGSLPEGDAAWPLRSMLRETDQPASAMEIAWGFRKLVEQEAQQRPLVVVLDDLHWASEALLDLIEHVADLSRDAPLLLLCMARPDFLERRPSWGGGKWNATALLLEPLDGPETVELLAQLGGVRDSLVPRIVEAAEGNPLFVEEMVALLRESPEGQVQVPGTIQALVAARLDQLDPVERSVLERGAIEGRVFHRGALLELSEGGGEVDGTLTSLVRKDLVRSAQPQIANEDAYRFRHLLIRDAAYDALPKAVRADLHQRFAEWLSTHGRDLIEIEEIVGYHLERAVQLLTELGRPDPGLAEVAMGHLATAGRRALWQGDRRSAGSLLQRALALTDRPAARLRIDAARCITHAPDAAIQHDAVAAAADLEGDLAGAALARVLAAYERTWVGNGSVAQLQQRAAEALPLLEATADHAGLAEVWASLANGAHNGLGEYERMELASEKARHHASLAGQPQSFLWLTSQALVLGPRPAREALAKVDALMVDHPDPRSSLDRAILLAMLDEVDEAREVARAGEARLREMGDSEIFFQAAHAEIEQIAGDGQAAATWMERAYRFGVDTDVVGTQGTYGAMWAVALCGLDRHDEAEALAAECRDVSAEDDLLSQLLWREAWALVSSHRGAHDEAERCAREAVDITARTDSPAWTGDALSVLGRVLDAAGKPDSAAAQFQKAWALYDRKQVIPLARRTRQRLDDLKR